MFLVVLLYALFASVFTVSKQALIYAQPFFLVGIRMFFAGALMLIFQYCTKPQECIIKKGSLWRLVRLAIFNIYLTNVFEFWGLQYLTSFKTCFIYSLSPFVSAFLSYLIFSEVMTGKKWLGLLVGFSGFVPVLLNHTSKEDAAGQLWIFSWAELAVITAAICSVYGWILLRQLVRETGYSPFMANGLSMLMGGSIALIHSSFIEPWDPLPVTQFLPFIECTLFLIIVSNCVCYNLYGFLLKRFSATFMAFAGLTTPLFSALFGWIFHSEVPTSSFYVSLMIVSSGLLLFYQEELRLATGFSPAHALSGIARARSKWLSTKEKMVSAQRRVSEVLGISSR
jgi:drug/metabolite transporter (DMT)-like permease